MAELDRLLSFMSSWDRQATLEKYEILLRTAEDPAALLEELGTPTRVAIDLARTYVPTPSPARETPAADELQALSEPVAPASPAEEETPEQIRWDLNPEPDGPSEPERKRVLRGGALAGYLIPAILIGLPVAVALICLGLPFLAAGAALLDNAVVQGLAIIGQLQLVSDVLLVAGGALAVCAAGLLLCWLGLWLAITLCWLWVDKVLVALGRRLCVKEVPVK